MPRPFGWLLFVCSWGVVTWGQLDSVKELRGVSDDWVRLESDNFEVYSDHHERESRAIMHDLEVLRAVFFDQLKLVEKRRVEVTVYAFGNSSDYHAYARRALGDDNKSTAGLYMQAPDRAIILLRPMANREQAQQVVFHEYVHHLFRAVGEDPPVWFNEGFAELMAGIEIERNKVTIGHPVLGRLASLQQGKLMPLERLFEVDHNSPEYRTENHAGLFYAQSWALLHYWRFGKSKLSEEAVNRFIAVAARPKELEKTNIKSLFEACFGMDYAAMEKQLKRYVRRGRYTYGKVPMPDVPERSSYPLAKVGEEEIRLRLAELAVRCNNDVVGQLVLIKASEAADADPRVLEALGAGAAKHSDQEMALQYWHEAAELGSANSAVLRTLAREEWQRWFGDYLPNLRLPAAAADQMRTLLLASIESEPIQDEAYQLLAWVEGFVDEPDVANVNLVQSRFKQMDEKASTLLALSVGRDRMGMRDRAIAMIKQIGRYDPDEHTLTAAEITLAEWEGKSPSEVYLGTKRTTSRSGVARMERNVTRLPSVPLPEDL